jgi:hypothetical protein
MLETTQYDEKRLLPSWGEVKMNKISLSRTQFLSQ